MKHTAPTNPADIAYRKALGVAPDQPLPSKIGIAEGHSHRISSDEDLDDDEDKKWI